MNLSHTTQARAAQATAQGSHHFAPPLPRQPQREKPLWRQTVVVCNSQGEEEAFTVGPDGCVWNFFRDPGTDSGYSLINLNMPTDALAVSHDADGRMVVFSASGMTLLYRVELPASPGKPESLAARRWSPVMEVGLPVVRGAVAVKRLFITDVFDAMHIGAVVSLETADHREGYVMAYAKWTRSGLTFPEPSILLDGDPRVKPDGGLHSRPGHAFSDSRRRAAPDDTTFPGELPLRSVLVRPWRIGVNTGWFQ
jgi:hypothetical protein